VELAALAEVAEVEEQRVGGERIPRMLFAAASDKDGGKSLSPPAGALIDLDAYFPRLTPGAILFCPLKRACFLRG
jgi:hypothetical protein